MADSVGRRGFLGQFLKLVGVAVGASAVAGVATKPVALGVAEKLSVARPDLWPEPPVMKWLKTPPAGPNDTLTRESWVRSLDNVTDLVQCPVCCEGKGDVGLYPSGTGGSVLASRCRDCDTAHMNAIGIPTGAPKWTAPPYDKFRMGKDAVEFLECDRPTVREWMGIDEEHARPNETARGVGALMSAGRRRHEIEIDSKGHVVSVGDTQSEGRP